MKLLEVVLTNVHFVILEMIIGRKIKMFDMERVKQKLIGWLIERLSMLRFVIRIGD